MMKTQDFKIGRWIAVLVVSAMLIAGAIGGAGAAGPGDPQPGTVAGASSFTMYDAGSIITSTATVYGGNQSGEADRYLAYNGLDVFATVDISGTRTATITLQYSADGTNWVDATYEYVGTPLNYSTTSTGTQTLSDSSAVTATTVSTSTASVTSTVSTSGTSVVTSTTTASGTPQVYEGTYQMVLSADGSDFVQIPVTGLYVRPKVELAGAVSGNTNGITITVTAIARNN